MGAKKERFFVGLDQVGSVRALINSKGNIVKRIEYDSFGNDFQIHKQSCLFHKALLAA